MQTGVVQPSGAHQRMRRSGCVHAWKTSSRGASKTRVMTISRSVEMVLVGLLIVVLLSL